MGNTICCIDRKNDKDENFQYFYKKSDLHLKKKDLILLFLEILIFV